ncbi:MAG: SixA phosphatase family protein [Sphingomicrobium sp.]
MTLLTIVRHAKSSWGNEDLDDFDRPLNKRGHKAALQIGEELKKRGFKFDLVLASPALRVRETLQGIEQGYGAELQVEWEPEIYDASEATLFKLVRRIPERAHAPMLVGHNPGLQQLILGLTRQDDGGLRERVAANLPTGAGTLVELPAPRWAEVMEESGLIRELILPRDLD